MWHPQILQGHAITVLEANTKKKLKLLDNLKNETDHELFDYVQGQLKDGPIFQNEDTYLRKKSDIRADRLRDEGNVILVRCNNWEEAMKKFTKAVASAKPNGTSLCTAYGNRSDALYKEQLYNQCLRDIERALKCKPTKIMRKRLEARKKKAEDINKYHRQFIYHHEIPQLPSKNKLIPFASEAIGLETNIKWGQHVVAKKDISIGEVLCIETPYASQISPEYQFLHCHECLEMCYDLIPCEMCLEVVYCSIGCRSKAYDKYHKYECTLIQHGVEEPRLFVKMAIKAVLSYESCEEELSIDEDPKFRSNRYKEVSSMRTFKEYKTPKELFRAVVEPVAFYHLLTKYTSILGDLKFPKKEQVLKEMLVKNFFIEEANRKKVEKMERTYDPPPNFKTVGTAIYPFYSNFRHSCFCNAIPIFYGSKMVIRAIANIKKGELVTVNYSVKFHNRPKEERERILQNRYHYTCQCTPCELDWPMTPELIAGPVIPVEIKNKISQYLIPGLNGPRTGEIVLREIYSFYNSLQVTDMPIVTILLVRDHLANILKAFGNATDKY